MEELAFALSGVLTLRRSARRVPVRGSLRIRVDLFTGLFLADLDLEPASTELRLPGLGRVAADVRIAAVEPAAGRLDDEERVAVTVAVHADITALRAGGRDLLRGRTLRTASPALVPLRSAPGFDLRRGGRLDGTYYRPRFTGGGALLPLVNAVLAGPGNGIAVDLAPLTSPGGDA
jgi:hypothetical protein